jgi:hypothetical protein
MRIKLILATTEQPRLFMAAASAFQLTTLQAIDDISGSEEEKEKIDTGASHFFYT